MLAIHPAFEVVELSPLHPCVVEQIQLSLAIRAEKHSIDQSVLRYGLIQPQLPYPSKLHEDLISRVHHHNVDANQANISGRGCNTHQVETALTLHHHLLLRPISRDKIQLIPHGFQLHLFESYQYLSNSMVDFVVV